MLIALAKLECAPCPSLPAFSCDILFLVAGGSLLFTLMRGGKKGGAVPAPNRSNEQCSYQILKGSIQIIPRPKFASYPGTFKKPKTQHFDNAKIT